MRYPKLRELKEAIKALIKGPYTSKFPYAPHEPSEGFRGRPQFHQEDCMGCAACSQVCPSGAITFKVELKDGKAVRTLIYKTDLCIFCGQCEANCPTGKGITLTREFDLSTTGKREGLGHQIEKEFALCEFCEEAIVPKDQYVWIANRLGPLMFTNPAVFLSYLDESSLITKTTDTILAGKDRTIRRPGRFKILCPKCRREAVLKS